MNRVDWVKKMFGQCVLNGSQVWWTKETEEAIQKKSLEKYKNKTSQRDDWAKPWRRAPGSGGRR